MTKSFTQGIELNRQRFSERRKVKENVSKMHKKGVVTDSDAPQIKNKIELLEATREDSAIAKFIEKKGEGIHHIAFEVEDIHAAMARMRAQGYRVLNPEPKRGADNKLIFFLHPKDANGVLIELCQEIVE